MRFQSTIPAIIAFKREDLVVVGAEEISGGNFFDYLQLHLHASFEKA